MCTFSVCGVKISHSSGYNVENKQGNTMNVRRITSMNNNSLLFLVGCRKEGCIVPNVYTNDESPPALPCIQECFAS